MKSPQFFYSLGSSFLYDALIARFFTPFRQESFESLDVQANETVLIAGAGTGLDFPHVPKEGNFIAFDLNEGMLKQAQKRKRENISLVRTDCHTLPFQDATFDKVSCFLIVSIIPSPELFFAELHRVLKPGGRIVVFDKFYEGQNNPLLNAINLIASRVASNINFNFSDFSERELAQSFKITADEGKALSGYFRFIQLERLP